LIFNDDDDDDDDDIHLRRCPKQISFLGMHMLIRQNISSLEIMFLANPWC
jgi:hypothetical protein